MFEPYMTCLYEAIYVALKKMGRQDSLQVITSSLGFSFEANIRSRAWMLCGQSDIDYYYPRLNRGMTAHWESLSPEYFHDYLCQKLLSENISVILETEPLLISYYENLGLGGGLPHSLVIANIDRSQNILTVYDKLASDKKIQRCQEGFFKVPYSMFEEAIKESLYVLEYEGRHEPLLEWKEELRKLCHQSHKNMLKTVQREAYNFQAFGLEGMKLMSKTLKNFDTTYHDDALSLWLMTNRIPINIGQSVYGNRLLFHHAIKQCSEFSKLEPFLKEVVKGWLDIRRSFIRAGNGEISYNQLSETILRIHDHEFSLTEKMTDFL